jgi:hypothetical protein
MRVASWATVAIFVACFRLPTASMKAVACLALMIEAVSWSALCPRSSGRGGRTNADTHRLNLPMPKGRGFRRLSRDGSCRPFRPRYNAKIATPPVALDCILPSPFPCQCREGISSLCWAPPADKSPCGAFPRARGGLTSSLVFETTERKPIPRARMGDGQPGFL